MRLDVPRSTCGLSPALQGRLQVSSPGATAPVWDKRSLTLYYLEADGARLHLLAASLRTAPALAVVGRRLVLADVRLEEVENHPNYDVDPSGTRFVMPEAGPDGRARCDL